MRYFVIKQYTWSTMQHVHSIELSKELARAVARAISLQPEVMSWVEEEDSLEKKRPFIQ